MTRIALGVEYDGQFYRGWQTQLNAQGVQPLIEQALSKVAGHPIAIVCAGRTDAGVHATGQVVHFDTETARVNHAWVLGTNTHLPPSIRILWMCPVSLEFNARHKALSRQYRYVIYNSALRPALFAPYVSWFYKKLDESKMAEAANFWLGEHDFSSFRANYCQSKTPIRTIHKITVKRNNDYIIIDIQANAFLYHMVRNMVGVLMAIGLGEQPPQHAQAVLQQKNRLAAGITASPKGLYLTQVRYPERFNIPLGNEGPNFS